VEGVVTVLVVVLLGVAMVATWTWALWPQRKTAADQRKAAADQRKAVVEQPVVVPLPRMESTEGLLVAQLFRGELTGPQYRRAMECLAARDEERHPITIPGDGV
jgi:cbb3-type cytochrome oxidase subunit 3